MSVTAWDKLWDHVFAIVTCGLLRELTTVKKNKAKLKVLGGMILPSQDTSRV